jgi:hypothetical protein
LSSNDLAAVLASCSSAIFRRDLGWNEDFPPFQNQVHLQSAIDGSTLDVAPQKLLAVQLCRAADACATMERCLAGVDVAEIQTEVARPVRVALETRAHLDRLSAGLPIARVIDVVDALCMIAAGLSAISTQYDFQLHTCMDMCLGMHLEQTYARSLTLILLCTLDILLYLIWLDNAFTV